MSRFVSRQEAIESGAAKYFTGAECKRGHVSERWTLTGNCCQCTREATDRARDRVRAARAAMEASKEGSGA